MSKQRVLLVEDNEDNFDLVNFLLERAGYEVIPAHDGRMGLDLARSAHPDLILMDLSLPEVDGWAAAKELKADPKTVNIPLFALTAHTLPGDRKRALEAGFDGYLSKPINVMGFAQTVSDALQVKSKKKS
jgi:two-component system, cell cycle response regulator DivK